MRFGRALIGEARVRLLLATSGPPGEPEEIGQAVLDRCGGEHQAVLRRERAHAAADDRIRTFHLHALIDDHAVEFVIGELRQRRARVEAGDAVLG